MGFAKKQYDEFVFGLKYRPEKIEDIILPKRLKTLFQGMVDTKNIGNILLNGQRGTGKTTVAFCLADQTELDTLYLNMSKENSIDIIRSKVIDFITTASFTGGKKIVIGDECDRLSVQAMDSLKTEIESFSKNCNFIFITNHKNKITPELLSRLDEIDFVYSADEKKEMMKEFYNSVLSILDKEGITYDKNAIGNVIKSNFPDMRKILNILNLISKQNDKKITSEFLDKTSFLDNDLKELYKHMSNKDFSNVKKVIMTLPIDLNSFYSTLFRTIHMCIKPNSLPTATLIIAKYSYQSAFSNDAQIPLTACCTELMVDCEWNE